ncbi:MAG TPA: nucleotidyltransferase family protein [Thermoanaerobaculia bacterium]|jgi:hypothetical protein
MPPPRALPIEIPQAELAAFCRKWGIRKLSFFGSVVRDDFTDASDVDVLVEFGDRTAGLSFFHTMPEELSTILGGRPVDLLTPGSLSRSIRDDVLSEAVVQYDEAF